MHSSEDVLTRHWSQPTAHLNGRPYHAYKFFNPRWRKTQVALFSSCVNADKSSDKAVNGSADKNNNTNLTPPKITMNCNSEELVFSSRSLPQAGLPVVEESSINDTALLSPGRRASEPINQDGVAILGSFGRRRARQLNRSLSAGVVKEKPPTMHQHQRLTKSKSSDPTCRGIDNDTSPVAFNFSPEFVRKTSLRTSLHDWLGSHKVHMPTKSFRKSKKSTNGDSGVTAGDGDGRQLEKPSSEAPKKIAGQNERVQIDASSPKHVYRRLSADSLQVNRKQCVSRRPSAPPSFSEVQTCVRKKSVEVKTMTSPQTIRHAAIVTCCDTDTKYANLLDFHLHCVIKEELRSRLGGLCFNPDSCRTWCEEISEDIKARVQLLCTSTYKVICTVYIGALRDFGLHSATQALLDCKMDQHASASYRNKSLFAVASVFAVRYRSK